MSETKHVFIERGIKAVFDEEWTVIKLDEHRYYKRLSGHGISGVDFMAVHPEFGLALIEMKNYTNGSTIPENIDTRMIEKRRDTIRLIRIINKYFERQFYFRLLKRIGWKRLFPKEWRIWMEAKGHLDNENLFFIGIVDY